MPDSSVNDPRHSASAEQSESNSDPVPESAHTSLPRFSPSDAPQVTNAPVPGNRLATALPVDNQVVDDDDDDDDDADSDSDSDSITMPSAFDPYTRLLDCPACECVLHSPLTLHCGHTICSLHVAPSGSSAIEQRPLVCPLPTCPSHTSRAAGPPPINIPSGSNVAYFPAAPDAQDAPQPIPTIRTDGRVDVTINKLLALVQRARRWESEEREANGILRTVAPDSDTDDERGTDDTPPPPPRPPQQSPMHRPHIGPRPRSTSASPTSSHRPRKRRRHGDRDRRTTADAHVDPWNTGSVAGSSTGIGTQGGRLTVQGRFEKELMSEVTCEICFMLLHKPVTTPCQHTFCGKCLQRSLDHSNACPLCREELPGFSYFQSHSINQTILAILVRAFPSLYAERTATIEQEERDARLDTPIFVCQLAFPGMPTVLHFFEPRYRLMLRRCLESPKPAFGMIMPPRAAPSPNDPGNGNDYGTMLEIRSVQMLPDGRSIVETWGTHRFRILERGALDGYMVGRIERVDDYTAELDEITLAAESSAILAPLPEPQRPLLSRLLSPSPSPSPPPATQPLPDTPDEPDAPPRTNEELMAICRSFLEHLQEGTAPWVVQRLNNTYGPMPTDASSFGFWVALVLPIDEHEKAKLLPIKSVRLRLRLVVHWIDQLNSNWWFSSGCVIL